MDEILRVEGFCKAFKTGVAVDHLSFSISRGSVFCLLGPNGAGKSTTIAMLASLLPRDEGKIFFDGAEVHGRPARYLSALGIVPQDIALYGNLSARANLGFFASLYGLRGRKGPSACQKPSISPASRTGPKSRSTTSPEG